MAAQVGWGTHVLHVEVLSEVLQQLDLQQRLQSCSLVCSFWRKAAAMSIRKIDVSRCSQAKATSLSDWLYTHAADAKLGSISMKDDHREIGTSSLILPLQQLTALKTLKLDKVEARTAEAGAEYGTGPVPNEDWDAAHAILLLVLPGLTRLDLLDCKVSLKGLKGLHGLQHLAVRFPQPPDAFADDPNTANSKQLQLAVPYLTNLTALHLSAAAAHDDALAHISNLTSLQELSLTRVRGTVTRDAFRELPCSLTRLKFKNDALDRHAVYDRDKVHFGPMSTPGLCRLTALQELDIDETACTLHTSMLPTLPALRKLSSCTFKAAVGKPTLSVLAALTKLEYLELSSGNADLIVSPADYAALTSSPQLTYLDLSHCYFDTEHAEDVFPDNLRLPKLASLSVFIYWLQDRATIQSVVNTCPGLEQLSINCIGGGDVAAVQPWQWAASVACLGSLSALTRLSYNTFEVRMGTEVFRALAALTGLQELRLDMMDPTHLGAAVQLTSLKQLTRLEMVVPGFLNEEHHDDLYFNVNATNKAPAGNPPDVWRQIPALVLQSAADYMETGEGRSAAVKSLLRAAAQASSAALQRESELEQRVGLLEQQVLQLLALHG